MRCLTNRRKLHNRFAYADIPGQVTAGSGDVSFVYATVACDDRAEWRAAENAFAAVTCTICVALPAIRGLLALAAVVGVGGVVRTRDHVPPRVAALLLHNHRCDGHKQHAGARTQSVALEANLQEKRLRAAQHTGTAGHSFPGRFR